VEPITTAVPARGSSALDTWTRARLPQLETVSRLAAAADDLAEADLLTRAYVLVLAAEFQAFFTDLLSDITHALVAALPDQVPPLFRKVLQDAMEDGRVVSFRNPDSTTLHRDLVRFDLPLRQLLTGTDRAGRNLLTRLDQVISTRNKLAHGSGSVSELGVGGGRLSVATVDEWSGDLDQLATRLDKAVASTLSARLSVSLATRESR
jgi:hypothetical protein